MSNSKTWPAEFLGAFWLTFCGSIVGALVYKRLLADEQADKDVKAGQMLFLWR